MIPRKFLLAGIIGSVVVTLIVVVAFGFGFLQGPANNPCPSGQCSGGQVYFTISVIGTVYNPNWGAPYATVDVISAGTTSGPPGVFLAFPKLDFWNNNYQLNIDYCLTYPNGQAYCTPNSQIPPPAITGTVGGGGSAGYTFKLYETGPRGSYSISVTVHYKATGCSITNCVTMDAQRSAGFTI